MRQLRVLVLSLLVVLGSLSITPNAGAAEVTPLPEPVLLSVDSNERVTTVLFADYIYFNGCGSQVYIYMVNSPQGERVRFSASWTCQSSSTYVRYVLRGFRGSTTIAYVTGSDYWSGSTYTTRRCTPSNSREYTVALDVTIKGVTKYIYSHRYLSYYCT